MTQLKQFSLVCKTKLNKVRVSIEEANGQVRAGSDWAIFGLGLFHARVFSSSKQLGLGFFRTRAFSGSNLLISTSNPIPTLNPTLTPKPDPYYKSDPNIDLDLEPEPDP